MPIARHVVIFRASIQKEDVLNFKERVIILTTLLLLWHNAIATFSYFSS